jgi:hypothetical protein
MRIAPLALGVVLAATAACGGGDKPGNSTNPPTCGHGPNLVQTSSSVIVAPADVAVVVRGFSGFVELSPLVAPTDGKTVLVTWSASDASGVTQGHAVVAHLAAGSVAGTSAPIDAPALGVAAFDGTNFLVAGRAASPPSIPNAPASLQLQRVALDGSAVGAQQTIETMPGPGAPTSAIWTPLGLAVAWWAASQAVVQLFGDDGHLIRGLALGQFTTDPTTGLMAFEPAIVALFRDQLVVADGHTVSTLDWLGGPAQTSQTGFTACAPTKGGFPTLFETGGQLRMWGSDSGHIEGVFAGAPGGPFTQVGTVDSSAVTQQSDGCGGAVTLSNHDTEISVVSETAPERSIPLGTALPTVDNVAAMTTIPSGFAVAWAAEDGMHLTTLGWQ